MTTYTNLIAADPDFLSGFASIFDFGDTLTEYNRSESPAEADAAAIRSDWCATGQDLQKATAAFARGNGLQQP